MEVADGLREYIVTVVYASALIFIFDLLKRAFRSKYITVSEATLRGIQLPGSSNVNTEYMFAEFDRAACVPHGWSVTACRLCHNCGGLYPT